MHSLKQTMMKALTWILATALLVPAFSSLAHAQSDPAGLTLEGLEQGRAKLMQDLQSTSSRDERAQILENFHMLLRNEIMNMNPPAGDNAARPVAYWPAINLDQRVIDLIDRDCADLKRSLEMEAKAPQVDTAQAAQMIRLMCQ